MCANKVDRPIQTVDEPLFSLCLFPQQESSRGQVDRRTGIRPTTNQPDTMRSNWAPSMFAARTPTLTASQRLDRARTSPRGSIRARTTPRRATSLASSSTRTPSPISKTQLPVECTARQGMKTKRRPPRPIQTCGMVRATRVPTMRPLVEAEAAEVVVAAASRQLPPKSTAFPLRQASSHSSSSGR